MNTRFMLLDNKPVWEIKHMEGRSEVYKYVAVNSRFRKEAYCSGDTAFIEQMERIITRAENVRAECGFMAI